MSKRIGVKRSEFERNAVFVFLGVIIITLLILLLRGMM
jgi:hypothetical protein